MYIHTHKCVYIHYIYDNTHIYTWWFITPSGTTCSTLYALCHWYLSTYLCLYSYLYLEREPSCDRSWSTINHFLHLLWE